MAAGGIEQGPNQGWAVTLKGPYLVINPKFLLTLKAVLAVNPYTFKKINNCILSI